MGHFVIVTNQIILGQQVQSGQWQGRRPGFTYSLDIKNKLFAEMTNLIDEFGTKMIRI